jgi:hypothetical protein
MVSFANLGGRGYKVDIDQAMFKTFLMTEPGLRDELDRRMTKAQNVARQLVRVRTGRLLSTIRKQPGYIASGPYVDVVAGKQGLTPYMGFEHDGTEPHVIRPRSRKALRFPAGGKIVFATKVNHPGTVGSRFLERALPAAGGN